MNNIRPAKLAVSALVVLVLVLVAFVVPGWCASVDNPWRGAKTLTCGSRTSTAAAPVPGSKSTTPRRSAGLPLCRITTPSFAMRWPCSTRLAHPRVTRAASGSTTSGVIPPIRGTVPPCDARGVPPRKPAWETVLDMDALAKAEGKPGHSAAHWLAPENRRCLIGLAPAGGDAPRNANSMSRRGLCPGRFQLPSAKSRVAWRDSDSLYVATDFGPGTLTQSGYPRIVKLWSRGTPLEAAKTLHEAPATSVGSRRGDCARAGAGDIDLVTEGLTTWTARHIQLLEGRLKPLDLPASAIVLDGFRGRLVLKLRDDWTSHGVKYSAGSIVLADPAALQ